jgi:predicted ATPase
MIERLYVNNFRTLVNTTFDWTTQRSVLLLGKNGAGKSTVLHALAVLQSIARGPNRVRDTISPNDFTLHARDQVMRFRAEMDAQGAKYSYEVAFDWPERFIEARVLEEDLRHNGQAVFSRRLNEVRLQNGTTFRLDWHVFALPVVNETQSPGPIGTVRNLLADMMIISPSPEKMSGFSEAPDTQLAFRADNFAACLRSLIEKRPKSYQAFEQFTRSVIPDFSSIEHTERGREGGKQLRVTFASDQPRRTFSIDFDALSDGERCLLLASYVLARCAIRGTDDPPVVCAWDEPDAHLSISEVGHLIMSLRRAASTSDAQFIATSHNPETIRRFSDENTFLLARASHLEPTTVTRLADRRYSGDLVDALIRDEVGT